MLEDPEIGWIERTGHPSWLQDVQEPGFDKDAAYDARREDELFGE